MLHSKALYRGLHFDAKYRTIVFIQVKETSRHFIALLILTTPVDNSSIVSTNGVVSTDLDLASMCTCFGSE